MASAVADRPVPFAVPGRDSKGGFPVRLSAITGIVLAGCILFTGIPSVTSAWRNGSPGSHLGCIPLLAVLTHGTILILGGPSLFRSADLRSLWILGLGLGLILYPASLGWGSWDPYAEGWERSGLFPGVDWWRRDSSLWVPFGICPPGRGFRLAVWGMESSITGTTVDPQFFLCRVDRPDDGVVPKLASRPWDRSV